MTATAPPQSLEHGLERNRLIIKAWEAVVTMIAASHVLFGAAMIYGGSTVFNLVVFDAFRTSPWWLWAYTSLGSGLLALNFWFPRVRLAGLAGTALWFANWTALLIIGLIQAGGPYTSIVVYLLLTGIHVLVFVVEMLRWAWRDR